MELDTRTVEELRKKLASRPSFFSRGAPLSTRTSAVAKGYEAPPLEQILNKQSLPAKRPDGKPTQQAANGKTQTSKHASGVAKVPTSRTVTPFPGKPVESLNPLKRKAEVLKATRDFGNLEDDARPSTSAPARAPSLTAKIVEKFESKERQSQRAETKDRSAVRVGQQQAGNGTRPFAKRQAVSEPERRPAILPARLAQSGRPAIKTTMDGPSMVKQTLAKEGRGQKGSAARSMAVNPQTMSKSKAQMASAALEGAVDAMRASSAPPQVRAPAAKHGSLDANARSRPASFSGAGKAPVPTARGSSAGAQRPTNEALRHPSVSRPGSANRDGTAGKLSSRPALSTGAQAAPRPKGAGLSGSKLDDRPEWMRKSLEQVQRRKALAAAQARRRRPEDSGSEEDDFVVSDDDGMDWRAELRGLTRYDPTKFVDDRDDPNMEVKSWNRIVAEENRSKRLARSEDEKEELAELERQRKKQALKELVLKKKKKKRPTGAAALLM